MYLGDLQVISNLSKNINALNISGARNKYIAQRKTLLSSKLKDFLFKLALDHATSVSASCKSIVDEDCYLYLSGSEKKKIVSLFNQFSTKFGVTAPPLDASSDTSLSASLTADKVSSIVSLIISKF